MSNMIPRSRPFTSTVWRIFHISMFFGGHLCASSGTVYHIPPHRPWIDRAIVSIFLQITLIMLICIAPGQESLRYARLPCHDWDLSARFQQGQ